MILRVLPAIWPEARSTPPNISRSSPMYCRIRVASIIALATVCLAAGSCQKSDADVAAGSMDVSAPAANVPASEEPADPAGKYDGMIVHQPDAGRGKDDGWFLVKDGKRRWITDAEWLEPNGYRAEDVIYITSEEFNAISEDPRPLPEPDPAVAQ